MQNNKNNKKLINIISLLIFVICFLGIGFFLDFILNEGVDSARRIACHEFYEQDNIDVMFVGSSHCLFAFDPSVFDSVTGKESFNMGSKAQAMDGSLLTVKEAGKYFDLDRIYLEINPMVHGYDRDGRPDLIPTYYVSDYMRPSIEKIEFLYAASPESWYMYSFFPAKRYWENLFNFNHIKSTVKRKLSPEYRSYDYSCSDVGYEIYDNKGYSALINLMDENSIFSENKNYLMTTNLGSEDWNEDVRKVIDYCKKNDIELVFVTSPFLDFAFVDTYDYDEYHEYINNLAQSYGCEYYDFNLIKEDYFENKPMYYYDFNHLCDAGADVITKDLALLDSGQVKKEEMLYCSYDEKMKLSTPQIIGIIYDKADDDSGNPVKECQILSNCKDVAEYRIIIKPADGEEYELRDYTSDNKFTVSDDLQGKCIVFMRDTNTGKDICNIELEIP